MNFRFLFPFLAAFSSLLAIIKIPVPTSNLTYQELPCSDLDRERITSLVQFFAYNGYVSLYLKTDYIRGLGAQINGVHPLKFLSMAMNELKTPMRKIFDDYLKREAFLRDQDGIVLKLERETRKAPLTPYIDDFAKDINVPKEEIEGYFANCDWAGLVVYLLYR